MFRNSEKHENQSLMVIAKVTGGKFVAKSIRIFTDSDVSGDVKAL